MTLLFSEQLRHLEHILNRQRWDVLLHQLKTVHILVSFLLRKNRRLVEATESINESFKCLLVALTVTSVLCLAQLLRGRHFVD